MQIESFLKKSKRKKHNVVASKTPAPQDNTSELTSAKVNYIPKTHRSWDYLHKDELKGTQKVHKDELKGTQKVTSYLKLYGVQKQIILQLYHSSEFYNFKYTKKLTNTDIAALASINICSVKTSIQRLKEKKCIYVKEVQKGRNGWTIYTIKSSIVKEIMLLDNAIYNSNNINTNIIIKEEKEKNFKTEVHKYHENETDNKSKFITKPLQEITKSYKYQNPNTILQSETAPKKNDKIKYEELPEEWKNINYHFLDDLHFKQHHIVGLYKLDVLEPEVVQESIEHFAYGIKHNPDNYTKYTDPLKVFYGSLRKGKPWTESTYKSTKEMATEDLIQRRKSEKRKIANETCKLVEEMEKESYEKWYYSLSEEEKKEIKEKHKLQESGIFNIFDEKIYKLHYGKYVMEEYKDPSELALEEFIAKKKRKEEAEAKRIKKMLQEGGMIKEYYKWAGELKEVEIKEITEEEGGMTERGQNKMIIYYAKQIAK